MSFYFIEKCSMPIQTARCNFWRVSQYSVCLVFRTILVILPLKFYHYGSRPLVVIYMGLFTFLTLFFAFLLCVKEPLPWWPRLPHYMLYFISLIVTTMTLYLPFFHIVSILLSIDVCISYISLLQTCPFSNNPNAWWT